MKIGILVFTEKRMEGPSTPERLVEAAEARGHEAVTLYEPRFCFSRLAADMEIYYEGRPFVAPDVIITRPNFVEEPSLHLHTTAFLERAGVRVLNGADAIAASKNKLVQHERFARESLPCPPFAIASSVPESRAAAERIGFPVVVKVAFGTHGKGVFFCPDAETFRPVADYLLVRDGNPILIERFVIEANRKDIRAFVVGGQVIAAMQRIAPKGDIRANMAQGASATPADLTDAEETLVLRTAAAFNLDIAGVDFLRTPDGPLLLEVNANPGLKEIERATGKDVAGAIVEFATTAKKNRRP